METLFQLPALRGAVALRLYASCKLCNDFPSTGTRYNTFCYYDFARAILKDTDTIHLRLLLSPGMESHSFEPAPSDILAIQNADLFLYNGGHMEEWVSQVLDSDEQSHPDRIVRCMMDYAPLLKKWN